MPLDLAATPVLVWVCLRITRAELIGTSRYPACTSERQYRVVGQLSEQSLEGLPLPSDCVARQGQRQEHERVSDCRKT